MVIYKLLQAGDWAAFDRSGVFAGSADDVRDGFIHLSTADQVAGTAAKYFAGSAGVLLVGIAAAALAPSLRWEPSRGGALFPHLYRPLTRADVVSVVPFDAALVVH